MSTLLAPLPAPPALDKVLQVHDLAESRDLYNTLREDGDQPPVDDQHIQRLAELFVRHNAQSLLGVHLIHGHFTLPEDTILLGTNFEGPNGRWARITHVNDLGSLAIHGHIFVFGNTGLCAYEYQEGPYPDLSPIGPGFLHEFTEYLVHHNLTDLIGLQILSGCDDRPMSELLLDDGTVMLQTDEIKGGFSPYRVTGWKFEAGVHGPRACMANETHSSMTTGNHKVFNVGKPLPKLHSVDELKLALAEAGVL